MQIRISGPGAIFTSAKCRCSVREEALAPLQIFARLGSHTLAHACAQLSSESRVVFAWRSKRVTRNEPLFLVSKKRLESPLTLLDPSLCDLWKIHHVPRAFSPLPPSSPSPFCSLFSFSSTRLFFGFLLVAFAFCSRWEGIEFYGWVEWYTRNSLGIYVSPLGKISSARCFR